MFSELEQTTLQKVLPASLHGWLLKSAFTSVEVVELSTHIETFRKKVIKPLRQSPNPADRRQSNFLSYVLIDILNKV